MIYVEMMGCKNPDEDIVKGHVVVVKLTVSFETNPPKSRGYKKQQYKDLKESLLSKYASLKMYYFEICSLGFMNEDTTEF